jgi:hypothetical protein
VANLCAERFRSSACQPGDEESAALHPGQEGVSEQIATVNGLAFDLTNQRSAKLKLPLLIPGVEPHGVGLKVRWPFVAASLKEIVPRSHHTRRLIRTVRDRLKLPKATKLLLFACGRDKDLEIAYRNIGSFSEDLRLSGADAVSGLAFSIYYDRAPLESLFNEKRNLWTSAYFERCGIETIPIVSWRTPLDIQRLITWLLNNPGIVLVGIDFQDARGSVGWKHLLTGFQLLASMSPNHVRFVLYGVSSAARIRALAAITSRIHIVTHQPFMKATKGIAPPNRPSIEVLTRAELFDAWLEYLDGVARKAIATSPARFSDLSISRTPENLRLKP